MTAAVTRVYRFSASHRLHTAALSDEENAWLFGKCNNPFGHGHNYELEVTVRGVVDEETGLVLRMGALDAYVRTRVLVDFDGKNFNLDVPEFEHAVPTTENVTHAAAERLTLGWEQEFGRTLKLTRVHLQETARNGFELVIEDLNTPESSAFAIEEVALGNGIRR
jgi:6-pyruvoyltetrahydropterin/6-carboxytetrahydropterin synthase